MLAFLGLGHMGTPMAQRLVAAGVDVTAWNRTASRTASLASAGARVASSPAEAVSGAEVVITMLSDPAAVESVLFGHDGAVPALGSARLVEMSTIGPDAVRGIAARLPAGVTMVDAPVFGSVGAAESGGLRIFAGGSPADLDAVTPILSHLGTVVRCGELGSGAAAKLVGNTALVGGLTVLGETLTLAESLGVPRELALQVLGAGPLSSTLQRAQATGGFFTVSLAAKDLGLAAEAAELPVSAAALEVVRAAAARHANEDVRVLANLD
jgi:3-hydroxyisobutyrate dehydrogenase-like beta-hydroxyacid dehydrogenase